MTGRGSRTLGAVGPVGALGRRTYTRRVQRDDGPGSPRRSTGGKRSNTSSGSGNGATRDYQLSVIAKRCLRLYYHLLTQGKPVLPIIQEGREEL